SAKDRGTGKEQSMTISGGSALPKEEIERMVRDAEAHAAEDKKRREEAETRNSAEQLLYSTEKFVADNDDKLPEENKTEVKSAIEELKSALAGDDIDAVKAKQEHLSTVSQKMGSAMYAASQASGEAGGTTGDGAGAGSASDAGSTGSTGSTGTAGSDEDVVDAEIVDEEENK
ncbi:MAG TPA: Hsp70 family protein, partial [Actinomycetales bacterium]|nr:Hsp70 family protein [Actinomycetales bacterium]